MHLTHNLTISTIKVHFIFLIKVKFHSFTFLNNIIKNFVNHNFSQYLLSSNFNVNFTYRYHLMSLSQLKYVTQYTKFKNYVTIRYPVRPRVILSSEGTVVSRHAWKSFRMQQSVYVGFTVECTSRTVRLDSATRHPRAHARKHVHMCI